MSNLFCTYSLSLTAISSHQAVQSLRPEFHFLWGSTLKALNHPHVHCEAAMNEIYNVVIYPFMVGSSHQSCKARKPTYRPKLRETPHKKLAVLVVSMVSQLLQDTSIYVGMRGGVPRRPRRDQLWPLVCGTWKGPQSVKRSPLTFPVPAPRLVPQAIAGCFGQRITHKAHTHDCIILDTACFGRFCH